MGVYDTVWAKCPKCGEDLGFQTKSGECNFSDYYLTNAPDDVMANVNRHSPVMCECGCKYEVDIATRKILEVTQLL